MSEEIEQGVSQEDYMEKKLSCLHGMTAIVGDIFGIMLRASLRFEKRLHFSINPRKLSIFYRYFFEQKWSFFKHSLFKVLLFLHPRTSHMHHFPSLPPSIRWRRRFWMDEWWCPLLWRLKVATPIFTQSPIVGERDIFLLLLT